MNIIAQEYRYLMALQKNGNFSHAASELNVTQPALSLAVKKMEDEAGLPLFDRSKRPIVPTEAGSELIKNVSRMLKDEEEIGRILADLQSKGSGSIKVGGSHYINAYILPTVLKAYAETYRDVVISLIENGSEILSKMLSEKELDITFSCNEKFMSGFERYPAFTDHILLAVPKCYGINSELAEYALSDDDVLSGRCIANGKALGIATFKSLPFIILSDGNNLHDRSMRMFERAGIQANVILSLSQMATAYSFSQGGIGATFISDRIVRKGDTEKVSLYMLDEKETAREFYMLLSPTSYKCHALREFVKVAREVLSP